MNEFNYGNLCWKVESNCNMRCSMCLRDHNNKVVKGYESKLLEEAKALGFSTVVFTGGEPTLRDDLPKLMQLAYQQGFTVRLDTNGIRADKKFLSSVKDYMHILGLPLHGSNPGLHNPIVKREGHFDIVSNRALMARDLKIPIKITTAVTKQNIQDVERIAEYLANEIQPQIYAINAVVKRSLDPAVFEQINISEKEFGDLRKRLLLKDYPFKFSFCSGHKDSDRAYIFVNPDFTVSITTQDSEEVLGDLKSEDLKAILNRAKINKALHLERFTATNL